MADLTAKAREAAEAVKAEQAARVIMAKALKTQEPVMYLGEEILLKSVTYADDLIIQSIVQDIYREAAASGLEGAIMDRAILTAQVMAHVKMTAYHKDGTPIYRTMEDVNTACKDPKVFAAVNDLFVKFMDILDLTQAEKKRS